jgi:hypothetical protein
MHLTKKCAGTRCPKLVFLHLVGSTGHVVHSGESRSWNFDALFFMLGWDWYGSIKSVPGHVKPHMWFRIWWEL